MKKGDTVFYISTVQKKQFANRVQLIKKPYKVGEFKYAEVQFENTKNSSIVLASNLRENETN